MIGGLIISPARLLPLPGTVTTGTGRVLIRPAVVESTLTSQAINPDASATACTRMIISAQVRSR